VSGRPLTLAEWRNEIRRNAPYVGVRSHSHNVISIALQAISQEFGKDEANKAIDDFWLEQEGWSKS
jgi:hypothetical protein